MEILGYILPQLREALDYVFPEEHKYYRELIRL